MKELGNIKNIKVIDNGNEEIIIFRPSSPFDFQTLKYLLHYYRETIFEIKIIRRKRLYGK